MGAVRARDTQVDQWLPDDAQRVYAILDNLSAHRATDVLLFALAHPRWEFVFQPTYGAYLNLIEPWWKVLRLLALKDRRFETWYELCQAIHDATTYWNAHRHPFIWGRATALVAEHQISRTRLYELCDCGRTALLAAPGDDSHGG